MIIRNNNKNTAISVTKFIPFACLLLLSLSNSAEAAWRGVTCSADVTSPKPNATVPGKAPEKIKRTELNYRTCAGIYDKAGFNRCMEEGFANIRKDNCKFTQGKTAKEEAEKNKNRVHSCSNVKCQYSECNYFDSEHKSCKKVDPLRELEDKRNRQIASRYESDKKQGESKKAYLKRRKAERDADWKKNTLPPAMPIS